MGSKLWNNLNGDIQIIKNKNSYKKKIKNQLIEIQKKIKN